VGRDDGLEFGAGLLQEGSGCAFHECSVDTVQGPMQPPRPVVLLGCLKALETDVSPTDGVVSIAADPDDAIIFDRDDDATVGLAHAAVGPFLAVPAFHPAHSVPPRASA